MIPDAGNPSHPSAASGAGLPRVFLKSLALATAGSVLPLDPRQTHHLVHVRRMSSGQHVEVFDEAGLLALAELQIKRGAASVLLLADVAAAPPLRSLVVYSAFPKGSRADWMVEKLCELGVAVLIPLKTKRSVVDPGTGKIHRLLLIAREAARQSRRNGVLHITPPRNLSEALTLFIADGRPGAVLTTHPQADRLAQVPADALFIGPEGGWDDRELENMLAAGLRPARLTDTTLRIETAALCAAAVALCSRD